MTKLYLLPVACGGIVFLALTVAALGVSFGPGERVRYVSADIAVEAVLGSDEAGVAWPGTSVAIFQSQSTSDISVERRWLGLLEFKVPIEDGNLVDTARFQRGPAERLQHALAIIAAILVGFRLHIWTSKRI